MIYQDKYTDALTAVYISGQLFRNYLSCLRKFYDGPDKKERYIQNKYREIESALDVLFKPMDRELKRSEAYNELEQAIIQYHEILDLLLGLDQYQMGSLMEHIETLKKIT